MPGLFPLSRQQQTDSNGPLAGARLFLYDGGTSTPRIGYRDLALTSEHPNPILADSSGRLPLIYLDDGFYRMRLTTATGVAVFDDDGLPVLTTSAGGAGTSVDPESVYKTGNVKIDFGDGAIDGYVRVNGRSIGSALSGSTERANADTEALYTKLWPYDNIAVTGSKGASAAADFAANKPLVLPNLQGACIFGASNMGGTADAAFAALLTGTDTAGPGATAGADTVTILQTNLPLYNLTGSALTVSASGTTATESATHTHIAAGTTATESAGHTHSEVGAGSSTTVQAGAGATVASFVTGQTGAVSNNHQHTYSAATGGQDVTHTHTVSVTGTTSTPSVSSGGSGGALNKLPSLVTFTIYMRL